MQELFLYLFLGLLVYVVGAVMHACLFYFRPIRQWAICVIGSASRNEEYQCEQLVVRACYWPLWWAELVAESFCYLLRKIINRNFH